MKRVFLSALVVSALLLFAGCDDKVRVSIKVKTKEADASATVPLNAAMACCQAETSTKSVVP